MQLAMCVFRHTTSLEPKAQHNIRSNLQGGIISTRPLGLSKYWRPKLRSASKQKKMNVDRDLLRAFAGRLPGATPTVTHSTA